jgi:hypothetical protein
MLHVLDIYAARMQQEPNFCNEFNAWEKMTNPFITGEL